MRSAHEEPPRHWDGPSGGAPQLAFPTITPVVKRLVIANAAVFAVLFVLLRTAPSLGLPLYQGLAIDPLTWREAFPLVPLWQVLTYSFLHSPSDLMHLLMNLLVLYFLGSMLEGLIGGRRFLVHYLAACALGGLVQAALSSSLGSERLVVGASGGVTFAMVGAAVLRPNAQVIFIFIPMRLRTLALIFVGLDVFRLLSGDQGVAAPVHLTGAAYAFVAARSGLLWKDPMEAWEERRSRAVERRQVDDEERLDRLLERIHKEGMHSLSRRDREFLKRVSSRR